MGRGQKYPRLFKSNPAFRLQGRGWLAGLDEETRRVFSNLGLMTLRERYPDFPNRGGKARSKTAKRDSRGRFLKSKTEG